MPLDQINQKVERFRREGDRLAVVRQKTLSGIETEGHSLHERQQRSMLGTPVYHGRNTGAA